jgi:NTE family protein
LTVIRDLFGRHEGYRAVRTGKSTSRERRRSGAGRRKHGRALSALILSGGGARGAYECGVYQSLHDHGIEPDVVVGTSVGAINAAAIAQGIGPGRLREIWLALSTPDSWLYFDRLKKARALVGNRHVFRTRLDVWNILNWTYVYDTTPLRRTLSRYFDPEKLRTSPKKLVIMAVDVLKGECRSFNNHQIAIDHVLASASMPILFPWTRIGNTLFWDGGLLANVPPLKAAIDVDADVREIFVVKLFPQSAPRPRSLLDCIERAIEITLQGTLNSDIKHCEFINALIRRGQLNGGYREIDLHTIEFREPFEVVSIINFNREYVRRLIDLGKKDTDAYLEQLERQVGT